MKKPTLFLSPRIEMEDELPKMIPTLVRDKIPPALSFVTGAKILSLAWQDVPQFEFLRLWFSCEVPKALRPVTEPRLVLEVSYFRMSVNRFSPPRFDRDAIWDVRVGVCHREDAHEMREWLRDEGLILARVWLEQRANLHGEFISLHWRATFDEELRTFHITHKN